MKLIGREKLLMKLNYHFQESRKGKLQIVLVSGEAGAGKTSLVNFFLQEVKKEYPDAFIGTGKCESLAGSQQEPYLPFFSILEPITQGKKGNQVWKLFQSGIAELAPDWIQLIPVAGTLTAAILRTIQWGKREYSSINRPSDSHRRMVQYGRILESISKNSALVLFIEDLHWSDNASLEMISFLSDFYSHLPVFLILTYRPTDINRDITDNIHPLQKLIDKLVRYDQCSKIEIPPFSLADLNSLLATSNHHFPQKFIERIFRNSGGNPLFIIEYIKLLHRKDLVKRQDGVFLLVSPEVEIEVPESVQSVIEQKLSLLETESLRLISYASVQGEKFFSTILAKIKNTSELTILEKLRILQNFSRLINELNIADGPDKFGTEYQFIHALIQQVLYNRYLTDGLRKELHLETANILEELSSEKSEIFSNELALHFEAGGNIKKAINYYLIASDRALAIFALDDAKNKVEKINQLISLIEEEELAAFYRTRAILIEVRIFYWRANFDTVLMLINKGIVDCVKFRLNGLHAQLLYWRSQCLRRIGDLHGAVETIHSAIDLLGEDTTNQYLLGSLYSFLGWFSDVLPQSSIQKAIQRAIMIAEEYDYPDIRVQALMHKSRADLHWTDTIDGVLDYTNEAESIAEKNHLIDEQIYCCRALGSVYLRARRGAEALLIMRKSLALSIMIGASQLQHLTLYSVSYTVREVEHDWTKSYELARESIELARTFSFSPSINTIWNLFDVALGLGKWDEVDEALRMLESLQSVTEPHISGIYFSRRGIYSLVKGDYGSAVGQLNNAFDLFQRYSPEIRDAKNVEPYLGMAMIHSGNIKEGKEHLENASLYWKHRHPPVMAQCLRGLAKIELIQGNAEKAVMILQDALSIVENGFNDERINWPIWHHVSMDLGRALLHKGQLNEALEQALFAAENFKKWKHILYGEAGLVVGMINYRLGNSEEAMRWLQDAKRDWQRLELSYYLNDWEDFMKSISTDQI